LIKECQDIAMNLLDNYRMALLSEEGKFSCLKSAEKLENVSHDSLTRFLNNTGLSPEIEIKSLPQGGTLIFDDTSISKLFVKNIEGVRFVWCSSLNKAVRGYTLIKIIYVYGNHIYNLADIIWQKEMGTKNEVIREKLIEFHRKGLQPKIVLFDCGYMACKSVNLIDSLGWKYLTICKSNKIFEKQQVQNHKFFGGKSLYGKARGIYHRVQIAKHCNRYIMTNLNCTIKSHSGWRMYRKRWIIETIFRNLKSYLHLEQCSSRSLKAQKNHIQACMDTFLFLKNKYPDKSIEFARKHCLKIYHSKKINSYEGLAYAA
jgi:hypothetical protein